MWVKLATGGCHEQKSSNCSHQSKIKGFNNQWDLKKKSQLIPIWLEGMPRHPCAVQPQVRPGFLELCISRGPCWCGSVRALSRVDLCLFATPPPLSWQGPVQSMRWRTQVQLWAEHVIVDCVEVDLLHPHRLWWDVIVCLLVLTRLCCALFVTSGGRWKFLGEWASFRNRMVLLWACLLPLTSGPASGPLSILNAHFRLELPHPCNWMRVVGYLLPHGCLSCGLQGNLCSSTHLVGVAP